MKKVYVLGVGPGDEKYILPEVLQKIDECDVLIGGKRNLAMFRHLGKEEMPAGNNLEEVGQYIGTYSAGKKIAVLVTGDPGLYSMLDFIKRTLPDTELEVLPGISALQLLCARLGLTWEDMTIQSVHGRDPGDLVHVIRNSAKTAVFTGGGHSPASICRLLVENGLDSSMKVSVGECLSYENERVVTGTPAEVGKIHFNSLSLLIIENTAKKEKECPGAGNGPAAGYGSGEGDVPAEVTELKNQEVGRYRIEGDSPAETAEFAGPADWRYRTPGIPDGEFIRDAVPMTKSEVRAVVISKLRLTGSETVYDIGAGTGSVSVECALQCKAGSVYAVEKEKDALELIKKNAEKFGLYNLYILTGEAPYFGNMQSAGGLSTAKFLPDGLPHPDRVFIGGSGGNMAEIVRWAGQGGGTVRVVINTIAPESTCEALEALEKEGFQDIELVGLTVSRGRKTGGKHVMQALNPVYVISAQKD